jgi:hypothetical protein
MAHSEDQPPGTVLFHLLRSAEWLKAAESLYDEDPDADDPNGSLSCEQSQTAAMLSQSHALLAQAKHVTGNFL